MKPVERTSMSYKIHGLDCAEEVASLKSALAPLVVDEERLAFDVLAGRMTVLAGNPPVSSDDVVRAIATTGMRAEPWQDGMPRDEGGFWRRNGRTVLTVASGLLAGSAYAFHAATAGNLLAPLAEGVDRPTPYTSRIAYSLAALAGGWYVLPKAWAALRRLRPDMNLLMVLAVLGAAALGDWAEAATVAFLFSLSLALEAWSVGRARRAITALLELAPNEVRVKGDAGDRLVPAGDVSPGTIFIVRPGEKVPLDGTVAAGTSDVNQAPITGESAPVPKGPSDSVYAGTINGDGALEVTCTKAVGDTTLAHIVRLVRDARDRRSPSERWVERFARYYTPAVMVLALAIMILPPLALGGAWPEWVYRGLVLLVIACPCALVVATPVTVVAALAAAARAGILVKGGDVLEATARLRAIAFDKTGTLTEGRPAVVEVVPLNGHTEEELLARASALEARSTHPLARAVLEYAAMKGVRPEPADDVRIVPGRGVTGLFGGKPCWVGSHRYLEERGMESDPAMHERLEAMAAAGRTALVIGNDEHVCGFLAVTDAVRPAARHALDALRRVGLERLVILTGDNRETGGAVGLAVGADEVMAELLPAEKVTALEELIKRYNAVAMVGDGVNDAPALARATVGVAMGAAGTDAAIETADVALMSDDLEKLPWLIWHGRRTLTVIRRNIAFALAVKAIFAVLTLFGAASMWAAVAADSGATLLVVGYALTLLKSHD